MKRRTSVFYRYFIIFPVFAAMFMLATTLRAGSIEGVFESSGTKWTSETYGFAPPRFIDNEIGKGYEFKCDFSLADPKYPRCIWDAKLTTPADLSQTASIAMKVRFSNLDSVKFFCFYLKSNGKWFLSKYYDALTEGMNSIVFQIEDYRMAGESGPCKPALLNKVDTIRINVFPKEGVKSKPSLSIVTGVYVSQTKIDSYGNLPLFQPPEADKNLKRTNKRDAEGRLLENRVIFDMGSKSLTQGADAVLDRIKKAGFNVYILTAWHGRGAIYRSKTTAVEPRFARYFKGTADPTAETIRKAHAKGIQVYGQFCVAYRGGSPDPHPEFSRDGLPSEGGYLTPYDLQDPVFRDFIVKEIVAFATDYDIDGLNLDYVRAIGGVSFSKIARDLYRKKYNADIDELKGPMSPEIEARLLKWQEEAVSDVVKRVSQGVRAIKPNLVITVCGHPLPKPKLQEEGRNEWIWLENKWIDFVFCMDYGWRPDFQKFEAAANSISDPAHCVLILGNYDSEGKKSFPRNAEQFARLIDYSLKKYPDYGIVVFDYINLSDEQIKALRSNPFKEDAVPYRPKD